MAKQWSVSIPGMADPEVDTADLMRMALAKQIKSDTLVKELATGAMFQAKQIPGVYSDKEYVTTLLLSFFLGSLGVDRFYTGHTGIGVAKLLTAGGCGIWTIIDFINFAVRNLGDSQGRPLS
jgi:TM2 domain-containing membrane protein YozV